MMCACYEFRFKSSPFEFTVLLRKSYENIKYLLVNKCCVCLRFSLITVNRALQGVDHMVVRVVLIIVQYTVVCIVFCPTQKEKYTVKVKLCALLVN